MAIGKNILTIDGNDFVKGMSASEEFGNAGFSPETKDINLKKVLGGIYGSATLVNKSTNLTGEIIAECNSVDDTQPKKYFVADDRSYYTWNGTVLTLVVDEGDGSYFNGETNIIAFGSSVFTTKMTDLIKMTSALASPDYVFWSSTLGKGVLRAGERHPLLIFEKMLWIGDGNDLHNLTDASTGNADVLVLGAEDHITALGIDSGSGLMLIATTSNDSGTLDHPSTNKILIYDGYSNKPRKSIIVDDRVTAFHKAGGTTFVVCGNELGYWNGSGVTFLRDLDFTTDARQNLIYQSKITSIGDTLYIAEGKNVLAFGLTLSGIMAWYYVTSVGENITMLTNIGGNKLGISYATNKFYTFDTTGVGGNPYFYSNKYILEREVNIREIVIYFIDGINAGANGADNFRILDDKIGGLGILLGAFKNETGHATWKLKKIKRNIQTSMIQVMFQLPASKGVKKIEIKYDVAK